jgi:outer membrane receptor protein involved in Fe transport
MLLKSDTTMIKGILTDSLGAYSFDKVQEGKYLISVRTQEKRNILEVEVLKSDSIKILEPISVSEKAVTLNEVKVFGRKNFLERDFEKLIVNVDNMLITKGKNVVEMLSQLPGVKTNVFGQLSLNGKGSPNYMIDGKIIGTDGAQSLSILKSMSAENVERIEIISNPSAKYDAQGSGGIINIITKKQKAVSELRGGFGTLLFPTNTISFNGLKYDSENFGGTFNSMLGKVKTFASFDLNNRNDFQESSNQRNVQTNLLNVEKSRKLISMGKSYSLRVGGSYDISKTLAFDLSVSSTGAIPYKSNSYEVNNISKSNVINLDSTIEINSSDNTRFKYNTLSLGSLKNFTNKSSKQLSFGLDLSEFATSELSDILVIGYGSSKIRNGARESELTRKINVYSAAIKVDYSFQKNGIDFDAGGKITINSDKDNYIFKYLGINGTADSSDINLFKFKESINAVYINARKTLKKGRIQLGLRNENTFNKAFSDSDKDLKRNFINFFPNFNYQYNLSKSKQLQFSYSRRIRRPNFEEYNNFSYIKNPLSIKQGNSYLYPQFNNSFEATYNSGNTYILFSYNLSQNLRDVIVSDIDVSQISKVVNLTKNETLFALLTNSINFSKIWTSNYSISPFYQRSILLNGDRINSFGWDISTNHTLRFKNQRFEARLSYSSPYQQGYNYLSHIFSSSFSWNRDISKTFNLNVSLSDILGTTKLKTTSSYENQVIKQFSVNNGRNFRVSLRYKFKSGLAFGIKNRPNVQNNEIRMR